MNDYIDCGHKIVWRWKSVGQDGAFCCRCQRVYPVRVRRPVKLRTRVADALDALARKIRP